MHDNTAFDIDQAVEIVANNPEIGERNKGDLAALRVFIPLRRPIILAGYSVDEGIRLVYLEAADHL